MDFNSALTLSRGSKKQQQNRLIKSGNNLKGMKIRLADVRQTFNLKTHHLKGSESARYRFENELEEEKMLSSKYKINESQLYLTRTNKILKQEDSFRSTKPIIKNNQQNSDLIIEPYPQFNDKDKQFIEKPYFKSKNLQEKMNEYLNLLILKSSQEHEEQLKKLESSKSFEISRRSNHNYQNNFWRKMRQSTMMRKGKELYCSERKVKDKPLNKMVMIQKTIDKFRSVSNQVVKEENEKKRRFLNRSVDEIKSLTEKAKMLIF